MQMHELLWTLVLCRYFPVKIQKNVPFGDLCFFFFYKKSGKMTFLVCVPPAPGGLPPCFSGLFAMSVTQFA